jgi:hypothetical protein
MSNYTDYPNEKVAVVDVLPVPVTATDRPKKRSFLNRLLRFIVVLFGTLLVVDLIRLGNPLASIKRGCHSVQDSINGPPQHPIPPPPPKFKYPYDGETHFEFSPSAASGLTIRGANTFGKVEFSTSKLSDKVVIDLDLKTNKNDKHRAVSVSEKDGFITVDTPTTGKLETHSIAYIQIPSNIIGTFGLPSFELDVPQHMVDFSSLPESLEIGSFTVRVAKGFVKSGPVHTNSSTISVANGSIKGSLTQARHATDINVAKGNVSLEISDISSGNEGTSTIHLGNGHLTGKYPVYNSTTLDVAKGSIYVNVDFKHADPRAELSTKIANGNARVYVDSIAAERLLKSYHTSIAGDQIITYPDNFQGTIDARGIAGDIKLEGKDLSVEKAIGGVVGKKGDSDRNYVSVKTVKGTLDILVGDD